ncbi:hypothetical protein Y032_0026g1417 [Ancylostoma ceylanicum]|uniref:Uncharacterized protein n=1 Tax=Ancylostoma ceylanicum TaxID=53326 RepID=A0A016UTU9_9BILA|nr:hypothetical protein Y032_0026g1417 [Ancylostoma ceylanicum]
MLAFIACHRVRNCLPDGRVRGRSIIGETAALPSFTDFRAVCPIRLRPSTRPSGKLLTTPCYLTRLSQTSL